MRYYDIFAFGNVCAETLRIRCEETEMTSGPILYTLWAAHQLGYSVGALTKTSKADKYRLKELPIPRGDLFWRESRQTTTMKLDYQTESMETRAITSLGEADPYRIQDFPEFSTKLIYYSGLIAGEIDVEIIRFLSRRAPIAIDAQGLMRKAFPSGEVGYVDWEDKLEALPLASFLKADAAEAAFLTGIDTQNHEGRLSAALKFIDWGAREVVISHSTDLVSANESGVVSAPLKNRNSLGRTGRGDTCFAAYVTERFAKNPADAIRFAAALTSLKLETPGPFKKTRAEVEAFLDLRY